MWTGWSTTRQFQLMLSFLRTKLKHFCQIWVKSSKWNWKLSAKGTMKCFIMTKSHIDLNLFNFSKDYWLASNHYSFLRKKHGKKLIENKLFHIWIYISNGRSFFNIPHRGYTLNLYCTPSSHSTTGAGSNLGHFEEGSKSGTILGPHVKSNHWKIQFLLQILNRFKVNKSITNLSIWTYENTGFFYNAIIRLARRLMPIIKSPWTWVLAQPIWNIPFDFSAYRIGSIDPMRYSICWHNFRSFLEIQC